MSTEGSLTKTGVRGEILFANFAFFFFYYYFWPGCREEGESSIKKKFSQSEAAENIEFRCVLVFPTLSVDGGEILYSLKNVGT